jgi:hypothetical protein
MEKKLILILFICSYLTNFSQNEIQKLIYDDLILMNQFYNHCILQNNQKIFIYNENDTLEINETIENISNHPEDLVSIVEIDSSNNPWYLIKVNFLLNGNFDFFELFNKTFKYVLYKNTENQRLYKINGFFVSEYLLIPDVLWKENPYFNHKKIMKLYLKNDFEKIEKMFTVSVLKEIYFQKYRHRYEGESLKHYSYSRKWCEKIKYTPFMIRPICDYN